MRRVFAALLLMLIACPALAAAPEASAPASPAPSSAGAEKLGLQLILQSWTTNYYTEPNHNTVAQSIDFAKTLGLHGIEIYPKQQLGGGSTGTWGPTMSDADIKLMLDLAKAADVKIMDSGVIPIPSNEVEARKFFDWAKKVGLTEIVSEPDDKALPMIDKVAGDYGIKVAIHDHPKPSHYWDPEFTYDKIKDLKNIGFCADVGHWKRSGLDPVIVLQKYGEKVFSLHFKDLVNDGKGGYHDVPWGTGESKAAEMMAVLKAKGFKGPVAIEYEYKWDLPALQKCVEFFNEQANQLAK